MSSKLMKKRENLYTYMYINIFATVAYNNQKYEKKWNTEKYIRFVFLYKTSIKD